MLCAIGDLVEDVVVRLSTAVRPAADTPCLITRRRGGSAATVAATAARLGAGGRFVGRVGDDRMGAHLVDALIADGVDVIVERDGHTGSIVVLVSADGERTMLTDRGAAVELSAPRAEWLDGVSLLHVPAYSLDGGPIAGSTRRMLAWAAERGVPCSIDTSSTTVLDAIGVDVFVAELERLRPAVLFANEDEARMLGLDGDVLPLGVGCAVLKRGARPTIVLGPDGPTAVEVPPVADATDTTGAGDAFAAGFIVAWLAGSTGPDAARAGHSAAASEIGGRAAPAGRSS